VSARKCCMRGHWEKACISESAARASLRVRHAALCSHDLARVAPCTALTVNVRTCKFVHVCVYGPMATCIDSHSSIVCEVSASSGVTHRHSHRAVAGDDNRSRVNDGVGGTSCGPIAAVPSRRRVPTVCVPVASHRTRGCTTTRERERTHRPPSPYPHAWLQWRKSVQYARCYGLSGRWMVVQAWRCSRQTRP
jgi:hypothetical protein